MADMQFNSDQQNEFTEYSQPRSQGFDLTGMLIKWGIVSDRKQGEYILLGVAVLVIAIAFWMFASGDSYESKGTIYIDGQVFTGEEQ